MAGVLVGFRVALVEGGGACEGGVGVGESGGGV